MRPPSPEAPDFDRPPIALTGEDYRRYNHPYAQAIDYRHLRRVYAGQAMAQLIARYPPSTLERRAMETIAKDAVALAYAVVDEIKRREESQTFIFTDENAKPKGGATK